MKKTQTIFRIGPMELDKQDIFILIGMAFTNILLSLFIGNYVILGLVIFGVIFRKILISKGQLKFKKNI